MKYLVEVELGEPHLVGTFSSEEERLRHAQALWAVSREDSLIFRLDIDENGVPEVEAISLGEMEDA